MIQAIKDKGSSQRRTCEPVGLAPKTHRDASARPDDADAPAQLGGRSANGAG